MTVLLVPFWRQLKLKLTHNILNIFFLQNCEKLKYHFLPFLPITWVKIEIQIRALHKMNGWNLYFVTYFMCNIQKLNLRRPRTSNITVKFIESPFSFLIKFSLKVHIFWEGHRILWNLHQLFDWQGKGQIIGGDYCKNLWPFQNIWTWKYNH